MKRYGQTTRGVQTGDYTYSIVPNMQEDALGNWVSYSDHEAALKEAVAKEREACAKVAEEMANATDAACNEIAEAIRARGTTTPNARLTGPKRPPQE